VLHSNAEQGSLAMDLRTLATMLYSAFRDFSNTSCLIGRKFFHIFCDFLWKETHEKKAFDEKNSLFPTVFHFSEVEKKKNRFQF